jgi:hypothetical protein
LAAGGAQFLAHLLGDLSAVEYLGGHRRAPWVGGAPDDSEAAAAAHCP